MSNQPTLSTNTIIVLVVFFCCALMTSLFVYHARHKQELAVFANGDATLFPVPRDIKPFKLTTEKRVSFSQNDLRDHWTLLFFGFTHCATICPTALDSIAHAYPTLVASLPNLQIVLVTLDPARDAPENLHAYLSSFHPSFIGVTGKIQDIRKLQSEFGIFSARAAGDNAANYQLQHTPSILLINPEGKWAGIIKPNMAPAYFAKIVTDMATSHA